MSKFEWITCIISAVLLVVAFAFYDQWDSERSKRIELEAKIARRDSIYNDRVFSNDGASGSSQMTLDSLPAVPPKDIDSVIGHDYSVDTILVDSSEVTE